MRVFVLLMTLVLSLLLTACSEKSGSEMNPAGKTGIVGGTLVAEGAPISRGIVGIYDDSGDGAICTGSLIADDIVLTAAHCVFETTPDQLKIVFANDMMSMLGSLEPGAAIDYIRQVSDFKFHEDYNPEEQEENPFDWSDIAVIRFQGGLPEGYKPAKMLQDKSLLKPGIMVTMAGYGVDKIDVIPINPKKIKNLNDAVETGEVICDEDRKDCMKVELSGDGDLRQTSAQVGYVIRTEVRLDETKGSATCLGDSGGPVYIEKDGEYLLFGITSRGSGLCNNIGIYTNAFYYKDWISTAIKILK